MKKYKKKLGYAKYLRLLYIENNYYIRVDTLKILEIFFEDIIITSSEKEGLKKFIYFQNSKNEKPIDIIITDINIPKINHLEIIRNIRKIDENIPIIILSAYKESEFFIQSIQLGVNDYLLKPLNIKKLKNALKNSLKKLILINKSKENLQLLHEYQDVIDKSSIVSKTDTKGLITYVNDEFCKTSQYTRDELIVNSYNIVRHPDNSPLMYKELWNTIKNKKQIFQGMIKNISKDKKDYYVNSTIKPILDNDGEIIEYISVRHDVSKLVELHNKMESLRAYDIQQQLTAREKLEVGIINQMDEDEVKVIYIPLDILSGDFYSIYRCEDGSTFIYLIDGQGHGISPALTVFSVSSTINNIISTGIDLEKLIDHVFPAVQTFLGDIEQLSYTMIMISKDSKTISYSSGGMYPFLIKTADGIRKIKVNNTPFMNFSPNPIVKEIKINQWDSLVVFSDGLVEHENTDLDNYTPENIINEPSLIDSAIKTIASSELEDDVTLLHINNIKGTSK